MNDRGDDYKKGAKKNRGEPQVVAESNQPAAQEQDKSAVNGNDFRERNPARHEFLY